MILLDTNVAIALRDGDQATSERIAKIDRTPAISLITRIELEAGVYRTLQDQKTRREALDRMLRDLLVVPFTEQDVRTYGEIVRASGVDRRLILDRLIAAQAISLDAPLVTRNGKDFRRIDGLKLIEW